MSKNKKSSGLGVLDVVLIVQIILKLFGLIDWSWGLVLWPIWVIIVLLVILGIVTVLAD